MIKKIILILLPITALFIIGITNNSYAIEYSTKNLVKPDLTGKIELSQSTYRLYNNNGITIDYNLTNGYFIINGITTTSALGQIFEIPILQNNVEYTISKIDVTGTKTNLLNIYIQTPLQLILLDAQNYNTFTAGNNNTGIILSDVGIGNVFNNYTFTLQLEEGNIATPHAVPIYGTEKIYTYQDIEVGQGSTSEYKKYGLTWKLTPTSSSKYLYDIITYYLDTHDYNVTYLMIPSNEYTLYDLMGPMIEFSGQYLKVYYDGSNNNVVLKVRSLSGTETLLKTFYTLTDVQDIDLVSEVQIYDYENINKWYNIGYGKGFEDGDLFGYLRGRLEYGFNNGSTWLTAFQYGEIRNQQGYNTGFDTARNEFGIFTNGTWLSATDWGNLRYNVGLVDGSQWFNVVVTAVFSFISLMMTIELLPGVYSGYIVGFSIVMGVVAFITSKGKK